MFYRGLAEHLLGDWLRHFEEVGRYCDCKPRGFGRAGGGVGIGQIIPSHDTPRPLWSIVGIDPRRMVRRTCGHRAFEESKPHKAGVKNRTAGTAFSTDEAHRTTAKESKTS